MRNFLLLPSLILIACAPAPEPTVSAGVASRFRADAEQLYAIIVPACVTRLDEGLRARYRPARDRTAALEQRAAGTAFEPMLRAARERQVRIAAATDCVIADGTRPADLVDMEIKRLDLLLPRMERIVTQYSAEG